MSAQARRHVPAPERLAALKRHFLESTSVSEICDKLAVKLTVFYSWKKLLFENAHLAFENGADIERVPHSN
jgi:transposase-like protein